MAATTIELVKLSGIKPNLRISIPPDPPMGYWEDCEAFTDDEDDDDFITVEEVAEFFSEYPRVLVKADEEIGIFYFKGPRSELRKMKKHPTHKRLEDFIYKEFKVWTIEYVKTGE